VDGKDKPDFALDQNFAIKPGAKVRVRIVQRSDRTRTCFRVASIAVALVNCNISELQNNSWLSSIVSSQFYYFKVSFNLASNFALRYQQ